MALPLALQPDQLELNAFSGKATASRTSKSASTITRTSGLGQTGEEAADKAATFARFTRIQSAGQVPFDQVF